MGLEVGVVVGEVGWVKGGFLRMAVMDSRTVAEQWGLGKEGGGVGEEDRAEIRAGGGRMFRPSDRDTSSSSNEGGLDSQRGNSIWNQLLFSPLPPVPL